MTPAPENPPAFPSSYARSPDGMMTEHIAGMALRDWFAGQALAGALSNPNLSDVKATDWMAKYAYEAADAMLAARTQPKPTP